MFKYLRKKKTMKRIFWILVIVIVPAFTFWGSSTAIRSRKKGRYAGEIFGKKVSLEELRKSLIAVRTQAIMQFGENFFEIKDFLDLESLAWNRIILLTEAKRRKLLTRDKEVVNYIRTLALFKKDGEFNQEFYNDILNFVFRLPPRVFEEQARETITINKLFEVITFDCKLTSSEIIEEYKRLKEKVKVDFIFFDPDDFKDKIKISDKELDDYFKQNLSLFEKPETRNIQYLVIPYPPAASAETKGIIQSKTYELDAWLKKGFDFENVAQDYNLEIQETGFFSKGQVRPEIGLSTKFSLTAFELKDKKVTLPICGGKGCYILRLKDKQPAYLPEFNQVKDEVKEVLIKERSRKLAFKDCEESLKKIKGRLKTKKNAKFNKVVKSLRLKTKETKEFTRGSHIGEIGFQEELKKEAFLLKEDEISDVLETPQGFYILRKKEFIGIDEKLFEEEKDEFSKVLLQQKKKEKFRDFLEGLKQKSRFKVL